LTPSAPAAGGSWVDEVDPCNQAWASTMATTARPRRPFRLPADAGPDPCADAGSDPDTNPDTNPDTSPDTLAHAAPGRRSRRQRQRRRRRRLPRHRRQPPG
jgi:hypothetical protein